MAEGLEELGDPGRVCEAHFRKEVTVAPSRERLAWMLENAEQLVPRDGADWHEFQSRVLLNPDRTEATRRLARSEPGVSRKLILEGRSHADCLIECERAVVWVEGKRTDWLAPNTRWDATRDQLARNLEAAWILASERGKDYCLVICYERQLNHHERLLIDGYRARTWNGGWPHLDERQRAEFASRIGTVRWAQILARWPGLREQPALADVR